MVMNRRNFLRVASATALGAALSGCAPDSTYDDRALARPELLAAVGADTVRAIGAKYRAAVRAEHDVASLRAAILQSRPWTARFLGSRVTIADQVRADFERRRTVVVDGWILSETEARQCAIASLLRA
jgi:hypothetical protein